MTDTKQGEHTPLPWKVSGRGRLCDIRHESDTLSRLVAESMYEEDAKLVVHAVNSLEKNEATINALVEALAYILPLAEAYLRHAPTHPDNTKLETARAALRP